METIEGFHPLILSWFKKKYSHPTPIQDLAWPHIRDKKNLLITAPTGGGKTLAAFLMAINDFLTGKLKTGAIRVLYISPLKALNRDVSINLKEPLKEIEELAEKQGSIIPIIKVKTRSGDTSQNERRQILKNPPEILITTPESLNLILTSPVARNILDHIELLILDEIHSVFPTKRGTHLISAIERLTLLAGEFQRIALSATVRPLEEVADFLGGYQLIKEGQNISYKKREVIILDSKSNKQMDLTMHFPVSPETDLPEKNIWPFVVTEIKEIIKNNKSTLIFTNSRKISEMLARMINEEEVEAIAYAHHGSLSKEIRQSVEERMKVGKLKAIVSTSSLELGIDIGALDEVLLIQTPFTISSAFQRIGRSGHRLSEITRGIFFPLHGMDILSSAVMIKTMEQGQIEEMHAPKNPLDLLAQTILSMVSVQAWKNDELYNFIRSISPYHQLSSALFDSVINMLCGRFENLRIPELKARLFMDPSSGELLTKDGTRSLIYMSGGTIPDRGYFDLVIEGSRSGKIGELDEEFVWERKIGNTFTLGTQAWKITAIDDQKVVVTPHKGAISTLPFWKADKDTRDSFFTRQKALFLEKWENDKNKYNWQEIFQTQYHMNSNAAQSLEQFLCYQQETTGVLPHAHRILFEYTRGKDNTGLERVIIYSFWGSSVNTPFAFAIRSAWFKKYHFPIEVFSDSIAIMLLMPHDVKASEIINLVQSENIETLLKDVLEKTGFFGSRFRQNSQRALLTPRAGFNKRMPLWFNRLRSKKLLSVAQQFNDFPIILETWRNCLNDEFNLDQLKLRLNEIKDGIIEIVEVITEKPSPFSDNLVFRQTDYHMYQSDDPFSQGNSNLSEELFKEILQNKSQRPLIPLSTFTRYKNRILRNTPGYNPDSALDFYELVNDQVILVRKEINWDIKDLDETISGWMNELKGKIFYIYITETNCSFYLTRQSLKQLLAGLHLNLTDINILSPISESKNDNQDFLNKKNNNETVGDFAILIYNWINMSGPLDKNFMESIFGPKSIKQILDAVMDYLDEEEILYFPVIEKKPESYFLCSRVYEILLRMKRKDQQPQLSPIEPDELPLFWAQHQGILNSENQVLEEVINHLHGYPLTAELWEKDILPCRIKGYQKNMLDSYLNTHDIAWVGDTKNTIYFSPLWDLDLYSGEIKKNKNIELPDYFTFWELKDKLKLTPPETTELIWKAVWESRISNKNFNILRKGIETKFRSAKLRKDDNSLNLNKPTGIQNLRRSSRTGFRQWASGHPEKGLWFSLNKYRNTSQDQDGIEKDEIIKDQIIQIIYRYGFIFKEILERESRFINWKNIFPTLRRMELSGEIIGGYFCKDLSLPQFTIPLFVRKFSEFQQSQNLFWISAMDPVSPCGLGLKKASWAAHLPSRRPNQYLIFKADKLLACYLTKGSIKIYVSHNSPQIQELHPFFEYLSQRDYAPITTVKINTINDQGVIESSYLKDFEALGFIKERLSLVLRGRSY